MEKNIHIQLYITESLHCAAVINIVNQPCVCAHACTQACLILFNPVDGSPPSSSVHGIFQARILQQVVVSFSRGPSQSRD